MINNDNLLSPEINDININFDNDFNNITKELSDKVEVIKSKYISEFNKNSKTYINNFIVKCKIDIEQKYNNLIETQDILKDYNSIYANKKKIMENIINKHKKDTAKIKVYKLLLNYYKNKKISKIAKNKILKEYNKKKLLKLLNTWFTVTKDSKSKSLYITMINNFERNNKEINDKNIEILNKLKQLYEEKILEFDIEKNKLSELKEHYSTIPTFN